MGAVIEFENVVFSYGGVRVLDGINLSINSGEFVAVVGRNGSGKSTLAKHCNAILSPLSGHVTVDGMDTADDHKLWAIRQTVGMVFQNPDNQIVASVIEEDVAFALENLGVPPAEIRTRVDEALRAVEMEDYRKHAPHRLSGGQKQRVAIAGVVAMEPRVLVLDEPTAMLDPMGRGEVMRTIRRLCAEQGIAVVMITHHMSEAAQCDRVVVMDDGKIVMDDSPRDIFSQVSHLKSIGLYVPQTVELLFRLRAADVPIPLGALTVEECAESILNELGMRNEEFWRHY